VYLGRADCLKSSPYKSGAGYSVYWEYGCEPLRLIIDSLRHGSVGSRKFKHNNVRIPRQASPGLSTELSLNNSMLRYLHSCVGSKQGAVLVVETRCVFPGTNMPVF
jgi:hypothetical protein